MDLCFLKIEPVDSRESGNSQFYSAVRPSIVNRLPKFLADQLLSQEFLAENTFESLLRGERLKKYLENVEINYDFESEPFTIKVPGFTPQVISAQQLAPFLIQVKTLEIFSNSSFELKEKYSLRRPFNDKSEKLLNFLAPEEKFMCSLFWDVSFREEIRELATVSTHPSVILQGLEWMLEEPNVFFHVNW